MTTIVLDDEQAKVLKTCQKVELRDRAGNLVGKAQSPEYDEDWWIIKERMANPEQKYTREEVKEHLKSLGLP